VAFRATLKTPAKLNLGLRVGRKLECGYHGLETIFQAVSLYDRIEVCPGRERDDLLEVSGPVAVPENSSNLVLQALDFLRSKVVKIPPLKIKLYKQIPTGAGLGGGSANAAGIIMLAVKLWGADINEELFEWRLARELGADVPFFLRGGTAKAAGIGEQLIPLTSQRGAALIVVPQTAVSTEMAYSKLTKRGKNYRSYLTTANPGEEMAWKSWPLTNDFWPLIGPENEELVFIREELENFSGQVGLTGSGSGIYALFENEKIARPAEQELKNKLETAEIFRVNFAGGVKIETEEEPD